MEKRQSHVHLLEDELSLSGSQDKVDEGSSDSPLIEIRIRPNG